VVVVLGSGLHVMALRFAAALFVLQIHHSVALLQQAGRLGGIARDAVRGDGVVGALGYKEF